MADKLNDRMKLTKSVLKEINIPKTRMKLGLALDCSERTIARYIDEGSDNLTKAAALKVIREETGLTDEQILESVEETATK